MPEFTATEARLMHVLRDGRPHRREELRLVIDELAEYVDVSKHFYKIRRKIRPIGQDVICELSGRTIFYRHVRLLHGPLDE